MNKKQEKMVLNSAIHVFGKDNQLRMLLEEMSELQKEICKYWRGENNYSAIAEEITDVQITLDQAKLIFANAGPLSLLRERKLRRLWSRIAQKCEEDENG